METFSIALPVHVKAVVRHWMKSTVRYVQCIMYIHMYLCRYVCKRYTVSVLFLSVSINMCIHVPLYKWYGYHCRMSRFWSSLLWTCVYVSSYSMYIHISIHYTVLSEKRRYSHRSFAILYIYIHIYRRNRQHIARHVHVWDAERLYVNRLPWKPL